PTSRGQSRDRRVVLGISAKSGTAPPPILRGIGQSGHDRIAFDIPNGRQKMLLSTDVAVPIVALPERRRNVPSATRRSQAMNLAGSVALPRLHNLRERPAFFLLDKHVHVVGHDHPSQQSIAFAITK